MFQNWKSIAAVGGALLTLLPLSAQAGSDGRKNTAIALGAAAAYELLKGKTTEAIALGAGAAYAGKRYEDARKDESARNNGRYYYGSDYNRNTDPYYDSGYGNRNNTPPYGNRNNTYNNAPTYNNNSDQDYENYGSNSQYP
ncbi:MAG: hypothetical protein M3Y28_06350, partial [Armatimonadota bacterium]|nr:hypothetical protein [Armatimonadota bacterium]